MAIAGGASPSFIAQIVDNELTLSRQTLRQNVVTQVDFAVHELLQGRPVFLSARSDIVSRVRATVNMVLRNGGNDGSS